VINCQKRQISTGYPGPHGARSCCWLEAPGAIFRGPYISLGLLFRKTDPGKTLRFTPYRHQLRAFERLCGSSPRSTLVATGTGSGKTECFSLPILDHCAGRPELGVKAVVIYPMNALATDQARRFAREIHDQEALWGRVSVGLYVGEGEHAAQKVMSRDGVSALRASLRLFKIAPGDFVQAVRR
jgi:DEAD/DEAH box helicase domain-containing protein